MTKSDIAFVICQIGEPHTPVRKRADDFIKYIVEPAISKWSLKPLRSDQDPTPGQVTPRIIKSVLEARVVIADLTGRNPNVYYELAVAHAFGRPVALLIDHSSTLTFDTEHERVIEIEDDGMIGAAQAEHAKDILIQVLEVVMAPTYKPSNLVTDVATARRLADLAADDPIAAQLASIGSDLRDIKQRVTANRFYDTAASYWDPTRGVLQGGPPAGVVISNAPPVDIAVPSVTITSATVAAALDKEKKRP